MRLKLLALKVRYRWRRLALIKRGKGKYAIEGQINPPLTRYPNISFDIMPSIGVSVQRAEVQKEFENRLRFEKKYPEMDYEYRDVKSTGIGSYEEAALEAAVVQGLRPQPALTAIGGTLPLEKAPARAHVGEGQQLAGQQAGYNTLKSPGKVILFPNP
jgi:hypothetical protein